MKWFVLVAIEIAAVGWMYYVVLELHMLVGPVGQYGW